MSLGAVPDDAISGASFDEDENLAWFSNGDKPGTLHGTAGLNESELDLTGGGTSYVEYDPVENADFTQSGSIKFLVRPNYDGAPSGTQYFITIMKFYFP